MALTQEQFDDWLIKLREPGAKQARGALYEEDARCCLGVLGEEVLGWERVALGGLVDPVKGGPTYGVLETNYCTPFPAERQRVLSTMNDGDTPRWTPATFAEIADFIESKGLAWINGDGPLYADGELS